MRRRALCAITGVTGTNGKTTTAYVIAAALANDSVARPPTRARSATGLSSQLKPGNAHDARLHHGASPDRENARPRRHVCSGMEVSSHALDQHRVDGVRIRHRACSRTSRTIISTITARSKRTARPRRSCSPGRRSSMRVINVDDAFGRDLAFEHRHDGALTLYGQRSVDRIDRHCTVLAAPHIVRARRVASARQDSISTSTARGVGQRCTRGSSATSTSTTLLGGAGGAARLGRVARCGDRGARAVHGASPGRMETFTLPGEPLAVVDYAHTPDALEKALRAARRHCSGKLICVFGCGGDRDAWQASRDGRHRRATRGCRHHHR